MTSQQQYYCLVRVEEADYQEPLPRKNGWRYTGPDGRPYRQQVAFETGFRVHQVSELKPGRDHSSVPARH
jgi:hypothetical protein